MTSVLKRQRPAAHETAVTTPRPPHQLAHHSLSREAATALALDDAVADAEAEPHGAPRQLVNHLRGRRTHTRPSSRTKQRTHGGARARRGAARRAEFRKARKTAGYGWSKQRFLARSVCDSPLCRPTYFASRCLPRFSFHHLAYMLTTATIGKCLCILFFGVSRRLPREAAWCLLSMPVPTTRGARSHFAHLTLRRFC